MENYSYYQKDNSLLSPWLNRVVGAVSRLLPRGLSPNILSLLAHTSVIIALAISFVEVMALDIKVILIALLVLASMILGRLDGMLAHRSARTSRFGEFLAHFFEILSQGALLGIVWNVFDPTQPWTIALLLVVMVLLLSSQFYLQYKNNLLVKCELGKSEAKLVLVVGLVLSLVPSLLTGLHNEAIYDLEWLDVIIIIISMLGLFNIGKILKMVPDITYGFWLYIFFLVSVGIISFMVMDILQAGAITLLYGTLFIGKLMQAQLVDGVERSPGFFTPIILMLAAFTGYLEVVDIFSVLLIYLGMNILLAIIKTVKVLNAKTTTLPKK